MFSCEPFSGLTITRGYSIIYCLMLGNRGYRPALPLDRGLAVFLHLFMKRYKYIVKNGAFAEFIKQFMETVIHMFYLLGILFFEIKFLKLNRLSQHSKLFRTDMLCGFGRSQTFKLLANEEYIINIGLVNAYYNRALARFLNYMLLFKAAKCLADGCTADTEFLT